MASRLGLFFVIFLSACAAMRGSPFTLPTDALVEAGSGQAINLAPLLGNNPVILTLIPAPEAVDEALSWKDPFNKLRQQGAVAKIYAILVLPADMRDYDSLLREEYAEQFTGKGFDGVYLVYGNVEAFLNAFGQTAGKSAVLVSIENGHFRTGNTSGPYTPQALYELRQGSLPVLP